MKLIVQQISSCSPHSKIYPHIILIYSTLNLGPCTVLLWGYTFHISGCINEIEKKKNKDISLYSVLNLVWIWRCG